MAIIGNPSNPPSSNTYVGKGIRSDNNLTLNIYGHPLPNFLSDDPFFSNADVPWSIISPTTLFNVSDLTENHEVVCVLYNDSVPLSEGDTVSYVIRWYRVRGNKLVFEYPGYWSPVPSSGNYLLACAGWIGWLAYDLTGAATYPELLEIQENGDYYAVITFSGASIPTKYAYFNVKGLPPATFSYEDTIGNTSFGWVVRASEYFDSSNYIRAGISTSPVSSGQSSPPSGILGYTNAPSSNSGSAVEGTATGLTPGTTYNFYGFVQAANGLYYPAGSYSVTTTDKPATPPAPTLVYRLDGGFRLEWEEVPGLILGYRLRVRRGYDNYTITTSILTLNPRSVTGLQYGVTYYVSVQAVGWSQSSDWGPENPVTTAPRTPSITTGLIDMDTIEIVSSVSEGNWDDVRIDRYTDSSVYIDTKYVTFNGGSATWTGLPNGTYFRFVANSRFEINSVILESINPANLRVSTTGARPDDFSWHTPKVQGSPAIVTALEWNDFTDRINQFRTYKGLVTITFPIEIQGGEVRADRFNQVIVAISDMGYSIPPPPSQSPGSPIYASLLNGVVNSLNSIS